MPDARDRASHGTLKKTSPGPPVDQPLDDDALTAPSSGRIGPKTTMEAKVMASRR